MSARSSRTLTINSVITGSGGLTAVGFSGTTPNIVLAGANTFTGNVNIYGSGGLNFKLGGQYALQNATFNSVSGRGATSVFGNGGTSPNAYNFGGLAGNNNIALANNNTTVQAVALTIGSASDSDSTTCSGILADGSAAGGSIIKAGSGTLTLSGANTYTGPTTISAGTLKLGVANAIPGGSGKGDVTVNGTFDLNTFSEIVNGLNGSGTIDTVAGGTPTLTIGSSGTDGTFSSVIQNTAGTMAVTKSSAGTQTLSGNNTYTGATAVSAGTLVLGGDNTAATGATAVNSTLQLQNANGIKGSALTLNNGSTLQLRANTDTTFNAASLTAVSGGTYNFDVDNISSGSGRTLTRGNAWTFGGTVNVTGGNGYILGLGALTDNGASTYNVASGLYLNLASFTGVSGGHASLSFTGAGNTTLGTITAGGTAGSSGRHVYLNFNQTGTVTLTGNNDINHKSNDPSQNEVSVNSGTLLLNNSGALNTSTDGGGITCSLGNATASSTASATVLLGGTDTAGLTGGITISRGFLIEDTTSGALTLGGQNTSGVNTFSGNFTLGVTANTGKSVTLLAATGGEVDFTGNLLKNGTATAGITVGDATHAGTVKLAGANTYAGGTTIKAGSVVISGGNDRLLTTSSVTLGDGRAAAASCNWAAAAVHGIKPSRA